MITRNNTLKNRLRRRPALVQKQLNNNDTRIVGKKKLNNSSNGGSLSPSPSSSNSPKSTKTSPIIVKSPSSPTNSNNNNVRIKKKSRSLGVRNSQRIKILDAIKVKAIEPPPTRINRVRIQALDLLAKRDSIRDKNEDLRLNDRNKLLFMLGIGLIPKENMNKSSISTGSGILQHQKGLTPFLVVEKLPENLDKLTIQRLVLEEEKKTKKTKPSLNKNSKTAALRKFAEVIAYNNRAKLCPIRRKRNVSSSNSDIINDENSYIPTFTLYTSAPKKPVKDDEVICIDLTNEPTEDAFFVEVRKRLSLCNTVLNIIC